MGEESIGDAIERVGEDQLLEGEDPSTTYLEDAAHWVDVYAELLDVKADLLTTIDRDREGLSDEALREIEGTDRRLLEAEAERFRRRLAFWRERCDELAASA